VLFASAGIAGGTLYGRTDPGAAEAADDPIIPADVTACIFHLPGEDLPVTIRYP
jgi:hypothetical protein